MRTSAWLLVVLIAGCGSGGKKEASEGGGGGGGGSDYEERSDEGDNFVAPEILDQTQHAFARKRPQIADCYSKAVNGGKLSRKAAGRVLVDAHINTTGRADEVRISDASTLKSEDVNACIIAQIKSWDLPESDVQFNFSFAYEFAGE